MLEDASSKPLINMTLAEFAEETASESVIPDTTVVGIVDCTFGSLLPVTQPPDPCRSGAESVPVSFC